MDIRNDSGKCQKPKDPLPNARLMASSDFGLLALYLYKQLLLAE